MLEKMRLTHKQELFCIYYVQTMNQRKAAELAGYQNVKHGWDVLQNPKIQKRVRQLKDELMISCGLGRWDVLRSYMDIAFADISEFVEFGQDEEGENYLKLKKEDAINGQLIGEISVSRGGTRLKLADRFKALEKLEQYLEQGERAQPRLIVTGVPREGEEQA